MKGQQSAIGSAIRAFVGFVLLIAAHYTLRPLIGGRAPIDFLAIALLFSAVRVRPGAAAVLGFVIGMCVDSLSPATFGAAALSMTAVAFVASWLKAVFFADHVALTGLFVFVGKWAFDLLYSIFGPGARGTDLVVQLLLWSPLAAALTAGVAVLLLTAFRPLYRPQVT